MNESDGSILVGRYLLRKKIASGGMGSVYLAVDERLGRRVAVKLLREHLVGDNRSVERLRREARAIAALTHPNIAQVFDYGEDSGRYFIVMEFVEGRDLEASLKEQGAMDPAIAAGVAAGVCEALAQAHARGIVHRDVKPANILLGAGERVKVTDFGIARTAGDTTLTATGAVFGTPHYLAPEVAQGFDATPRSDIYSLGIVLYEMLTGSPPFRAESPIALAMSHVNGEVPLPSIRTDGIPDHLDTAVRRATAKNPRDRFTDVAEFADHLNSRKVTTLSAKTPTAIRTLRNPIVRIMSVGRDVWGRMRSNLSGLAIAGRLRTLSRPWVIGAAIVLVIGTLPVFATISDDPLDARTDRAREVDTRQVTKEPGEDLPASLETAFERLEEAVQP